MFDLQAFLEFWKYNPESPLVFTSKGFLILFVCFLLIYSLIRKNFGLRIIYITLFSLYFYYLSSGLYFLLLLGMSFTDYTIGYFLYGARRVHTRKLLLALSLVIDLGVLGYFKYTNFLGEIVAGLFNQPFSFKTIFLPVGISFFTFQSLSYIIDIYRRTLEPTPRWIDYLFYLSFFPQLVAGPIVRARDFLPQIQRRPVVTRQMVDYGFYLIILGVVKKVFIADYIGVNFVDRVFDSPTLYSGFENLMGIYGYSLQIYCDFSGYSDIAIGIAFLLGFQFMENFRVPYKSATITEFWRRWHISLSSWLKDYLYISMGGNRKGRVRTYFNLMVTMLLGGLWHGASIRFIVWGGLHGLALCIHKWFMASFKSLKPQGEGMPVVQRIISTFLTFHFVAFCWIIFRAGSMDTVFEMINRIFTDFGWEYVREIVSGHLLIFVIIIFSLIFQLIPSSWMNSLKKVLVSTNSWEKILIASIIFWMAMQIQSGDIQPFIYFQF